MSAEARPLVIEPVFSWWFAGLLAGLHALALMAVLLAPIGVWRPVFLLLVLAHAGWSLRLHLLRRAPRSIVAVRCQPDGSWLIRSRDGREESAQLSAGCFVSTPLIVLVWRVHGWHRRSLVLFADALKPQVHRRLRVYLRTHASQPPADS